MPMLLRGGTAAFAWTSPSVCPLITSAPLSWRVDPLNVNGATPAPAPAGAMVKASARILTSLVGAVRTRVTAPAKMVATALAPVPLPPVRTTLGAEV